MTDECFNWQEQARETGLLTVRITPKASSNRIKAERLQDLLFSVASSKNRFAA